MSDPTREAALDLLQAVLGRRQPLEDALEALPAGQRRDRAAAHRLAATALRRKGTLDAVIETFLRRSPPDLVRHVLLLGAAGLLLLSTPAHAALSTSVELAKSRGFASFGGLVNAVLRRVAELGPMLVAELDGPRLDTPTWLWKSWGGNARVFAKAHQNVPPLDVSLLNGLPAPAGGMMLPGGSVRFPVGTRFTEIENFKDGRFWVQDAAAALPARLLRARPDERVADLCAAPGGKTAQLADAGASVVAIERDHQRMMLLRSNLHRLGLKAHLVEADASIWRPEAPFDAVLLDAPCSATGTIRRHPDIQHLKRPRDVRAMTAVQDRLLAAAASMLGPGGRLVYSVCSLQPEEGAPRIEAALARGGLRLQRFVPEEIPYLPEAVTADGYLCTHPGMWPDRGGMDGFFAACLIRG